MIYYFYCILDGSSNARTTSCLIYCVLPSNLIRPWLSGGRFHLDAYELRHGLPDIFMGYFPRNPSNQICGSFCKPIPDQSAPGVLGCPDIVPKKANRAISDLLPDQ